MHCGGYSERTNGGRMAVFVIAEAGSCHDGSFAKAKELIWSAKQAGADACKFQYWSRATRLAERRHMADASVYEHYRMPTEWLPLLKQMCDEQQIEFMCTTYLPEDIAVVDPYVKRFKVSSFEAQDDEFVDAHLVYGKPVIVSLGMSVDPPLAWRKYKYLHCVSGYPTPDDQANIARVRALHGYSDHTTSWVSGQLATACGAEIIEKHLRLDTTPVTNPDYPHALPPASFKTYVDMIRHAEKLLGDGREAIMPCEADNVRYKVVP